MNVPLLDLKLQHRKLKKELKAAFEQVLTSSRFILGPEVELLEKEIATAYRARHAISCASGSDALLLVLMAYGIGPGDEVITTPYSFFATASCIARVGARAIFADISLCCYNLDPAEVLKKISPHTKAIIPVHLYGQSAEMQLYLSQARERGIHVIEDAAQAIGAEYRDQPVGALADVGCLSFFPTKNLGGLGDGGMLLTNDDALAEKLRILRVHGAKPEYHHRLLGINSRLNTLQATLLRVKFPHLAKWIKARQQHAERYIHLFVEAGLAVPPSSSKGCNFNEESKKKLPHPAPHPLVLPAVCQSKHVYNQFVIRTKNPSLRDPLQKHLATHGIATRIYYPIPLHLQECFSSWGYHKGDFPRSEHAAVSTLALPIFPELTEAQLRYIVNSFKSFPWNS